MIHGGSDQGALAARVARRIDGKAKPPGALGAVEALATRLALAQGSEVPRVEACRLTIFAADHGIAVEGVSAYPQAVTALMARAFLAGGAAASVFARSAGVPLRVVDAGMATAVAHPDLLDRRIAPGTRNSRREPAMNAAELAAALEAGRALGRAEETDAVAYGEMGIANTSAATLVSHKIAGLPLEALTGRGTGLDDAGLAAKRAVLAAAAARTGALDAEAALAEYGGFEIAMMAGAMLGATERGRIVLVDGFIATAAALAARALGAGPAERFVYCHRSAEAGHGVLLDHLGERALLDLGLRLGEGTGALLAWPIVKAAAAMLREMASLEEVAAAGGGA